MAKISHMELHLKNKERETGKNGEASGQPVEGTRGMEADGLSSVCALGNNRCKRRFKLSAAESGSTLVAHASRGLLTAQNDH